VCPSSCRSEMAYGPGSRHDVSCSLTSPSRSAWPRAASSSAASAVTGLAIDPAWNNAPGAPHSTPLQLTSDTAMTATPPALPGRRIKARTDSLGERAGTGHSLLRAAAGQENADSRGMTLARFRAGGDRAGPIRDPVRPGADVER